MYNSLNVNNLHNDICITRVMSSRRLVKYMTVLVVIVVVVVVVIVFVEGNFSTKLLRPARYIVQGQFATFSGEEQGFP